MRVLVVNAGSSSLKLSLLDDHDTLERHTELHDPTGGIDTAQLAASLHGWPSPAAVGHRIVHGGGLFNGPVRIDPTVESQLRELIDLAPLHQPKSLAAMDAVTTQLPNVPAVACFDTAFHATIPDEASTYAIPREWRERYRLRRYGFHGLSHAYTSRRAAELLDRPQHDLRIVTCHLGAGASLAAVAHGCSVDTTMGFTPLEGLVMATRSGSVDPGLLLWLLAHENLTAQQIGTALEHRSGLLALAGTADMRQVEADARRGDPDAQLAVDIYIHRLAAGIASMTAATRGLDVLVFTGGVGEHSAGIRRRAAERLAYLGITIDATRNESDEPEREITATGATVRILVIPAREDLQIARETRQLLRDA